MHERGLYPPLEPHQKGMLPVDDLHTIYWEVCGNPEGKPVIVLHGGPGAGCRAQLRQFFDPRKWRIILFDQRGCGRSTPHGETRHNTTEHLVADMEALREHLGIDRWHLFGGSWGSTLALAYGEAHPSRCSSFVLRGIYLFRQKEIEWYGRGLRKIRPEAWELFASLIPVEERGDMIAAYLRRLQDPDPEVRYRAMRSMLAYEITCATLDAPPIRQLAEADEEQLKAMPLMEAHYMVNNRPIPDSKYLDQASRIGHIPCALIHGRYDLICPLENAYDLHKNWPKSELVVVENAGHSIFEAGLRTALLDATDKMSALDD